MLSDSIESLLQGLPSPQYFVFQVRIVFGEETLA